MSAPGQSKASPVIGVDFDNTLVSYDDLMHSVALERDLIHPEVGRNKREVRDAVRQLPNGELKWRKLQGVVYGPRMKEARLIDGVKGFFSICRQRNVRTFVVSHKTEFSNYDDTRTNLQESAKLWMEEHGFFDGDGLGLCPEDVYFEDGRSQKASRIGQLGCTHFIDDLEEGFLEESFPDGVCKILYSPSFRLPWPPGVMVANTWKEITDYLFDSHV